METYKERNDKAIRKAYEELPPHEQEAILAFCADLKKIKSINYRHTSYGLKHVCERLVGFYVSNDALKYAMLLAGFKASNDVINPSYNVSKKHIEQLTTLSYQKDYKDDLDY